VEDKKSNPAASKVICDIPRADGKIQRGIAWGALKKKPWDHPRFWQAIWAAAAQKTGLSPHQNVMDDKCDLNSAHRRKKSCARNTLFGREHARAGYREDQALGLRSGRRVKKFVGDCGWIADLQAGGHSIRRENQTHGVMI